MCHETKLSELFEAKFLGPTVVDKKVAKVGICKSVRKVDSDQISIFKDRTRSVKLCSLRCIFVLSERVSADTDHVLYSFIQILI